MSTPASDPPDPDGKVCNHMHKTFFQRRKGGTANTATRLLLGHAGLVFPAHYSLSYASLLECMQQIRAVATAVHQSSSHSCPLEQ